MRLPFLYLSETLWLIIIEEQSNSRNVTCSLVSCWSQYSGFGSTEKGANLCAAIQEQVTHAKEYWKEPQLVSV